MLQVGGLSQAIQGNGTSETGTFVKILKGETVYGGRGCVICGFFCV